LWSLATLSQVRKTHGAAVKRLFVSNLGRSLAIFGRPLIGNHLMPATQIWAVLAPR
jgi:hypothetical protein